MWPIRTSDFRRWLWVTHSQLSPRCKVQHEAQTHASETRSVNLDAPSAPLACPLHSSWLCFLFSMSSPQAETKTHQLWHSSCCPASQLPALKSNDSPKWKHLQDLRKNLEFIQSFKLSLDKVGFSHPRPLANPQTMGAHPASFTLMYLVLASRGSWSPGKLGRTQSRTHSLHLAGSIHDIGEKVQHLFSLFPRSSSTRQDCKQVIN